MPNLSATLKPGGGVLIRDEDENSRLGVDTPAFWVAVLVLLSIGYFVGMHWGFRGAVRA